MGLDQYLYASHYASPMDWRGEEAKQTFHNVIEAVKAEHFVDDELPSVEVSVKVGYWRKSNAVHDWFVRTIQSGEDDCRKYYVDRDSLRHLRDLCTQVIDDNSLAEELLPTSAGFFFGSTDYDQYYFGDLMFTVSLIDKVLEYVPVSWDFYYQSSW
jgi:hypothetical protein